MPAMALSTRTSGNEDGPPIEDWLPLFNVEGSAQEHRTINKFFQKTDAISTVKLLDIAQQAGGPGTGVVA